MVGIWYNFYKPSFHSGLGITSFIFALLFLIAVLVWFAVIIKKFIRDKHLAKRVEKFEIFKPLYDGIEFNYDKFEPESIFNRRARFWFIIEYI